MSVAPSRRARRSRRCAALVAALGLALSACGSGAPGPPAASLGVVQSRPLPATIRSLPFTDQRGRTVDLASWRGKTVLVVPFLTLCTDICPLDTGNLLQVEHALMADGGASNVQLVELSVDPVRDTPARLTAYARLTGASWELLTETPAQARTVEQFFGWVVQRVPEDTPPSIDWWTGKPLTYDINHSDGFVVIDTHGTERFSTGAAPDFHGTLNPTLHRFLTAAGKDHLAHPLTPGWNPASALGALGWMLHRQLPPAGG
ncbi:MAG TPA: SCO family protein [Acidimicrobiales bacterium]